MIWVCTYHNRDWEAFANEDVPWSRYLQSTIQLSWKPHVHHDGLDIFLRLFADRVSHCLHERGRTDLPPETAPVPSAIDGPEVVYYTQLDKPDEPTTHRSAMTQRRRNEPTLTARHRLKGVFAANKFWGEQGCRLKLFINSVSPQWRWSCCLMRPEI